MQPLIAYLVKVLKAAAMAITGFLDNAGITPNQLTVAGLIVSLLSVPFIVTGHFSIAGWILTVGSLCDAFDGALARYKNASTDLGGFMDSVFDRVSEGGVYISLAVYFAVMQNMTGLVLVNLVFIGSLLTSYVRAAAEIRQISCSIGFCTRVERIVLLCVGMIFNVLLPVLLVLAIATNYTVLQRFRWVWASMVDR